MALYPEPLATEGILDGFDVDAGEPAVGDTMTPSLPAFHARALEVAEETVLEAIAARDAADRLLNEIDQLITPPPPLSQR